jgi:hypothetical protein
MSDGNVRLFARTAMGGTIAAICLSALPARAAVIQVDTTNTAISANDGHCGLAEAITAVNNAKAFSGCPAGSGNDVIQLKAVRYDFAAGLGLRLSRSVTIQGVAGLAGQGLLTATVSGSGTSGGALFTLDDSARTIAVVFKDLLILGGSGSGKGIQGQSTRGNSTLALQGVDVFSFGNSGIATGGIGVTINNSELSLNGGDSASAGGGISFSGTNQSLTVTNSTIDNNQCAFGGGGIRYGGDGTFTMKSSTVSTNHSGSEGGGLDLSGGAGTMSIIGSTIAYNDTNGTGGGVAVEVVDLASFSLNGSIIANNVDADFFAPDLWTADSNSPSVTNSLLSNAGGADFVNDASKNNLLGVDPQFVDAGSGLNGAGGPFNIPVHRIGPGSPALDHILSLNLAQDQRGFPRGIGPGGTTVPKFDIGAYEFDPNIQTETLVVLTSNVENRVIPDTNFSNGSGTDLRAGAPNDFVTFAVVAPEDAFYEPHVRVRTGMNGGKFQIFWSDLPNFPMANCPGLASTHVPGQCHVEPVGPQIDLFATTPGYIDITLPYDFPFIRGINYFQFKVITKTHGGTGTGYRVFLDYFNLKFLRGDGQ